MSSSSSSQECPLTNGFLTPPAGNPMCTMCSKGGRSVSRCLTCNNFLCNSCNFAHEYMVCFQTHQVTALKDPHDFSIETKLKKCPVHPAENLMFCCFKCNIIGCLKCVETNHVDHNYETVYDAEFKVKSRLKELYLRGKCNLEYLFKLLNELKRNMEDVGTCRSRSLGTINEEYKMYLNVLKTSRDREVYNVEAFCHAKQELIQRAKDDIEAKITEFAFKLSNLMYIVEGDGEAATGYQAPKSLTNGYVSNNVNPWPNSFALNYSNSHQTPVNSHETEAEDLSSFPELKFDIDRLLADDDEPDLVPNALPTNLPIVVSNPAKPKRNPANPATIIDPNNPPSCTNLVNSMQIYKTFGQKGNGSGQFNSPHGFCLGFDEDIVVADSSNHRIQIFDKGGSFKFQFGVSGRHDGHLWHPRKVAVLPTRRQYVVCDRGYERSRMQLFTEGGKFFKKIYIQFIDIVAGIAITRNEDIVVVDSVTPTVFIIGQNEFLRSIDCSDFMEEPSDIAVVGKEFYICDFKGHSVVVLDEDGNFLRKFGSKQTTTFPNGIDISDAGDVLVGDSHGNFFHVAVYNKQGQFIAEFRCPYVKVSRCCGLKITAEGYLVTVDKNYHHILMLDTLYVGSEFK